MSEPTTSKSNTLTILSKDDTTGASERMDIPQPKRGVTWLYQSQNGRLEMFSVLKGKIGLSKGTFPIPAGHHVQFEFSRLSQGKSLIDGGGLIAYHGTSGLSYTGSAGGAPPDQSGMKDEPGDQMTLEADQETETGSQARETLEYRRSEQGI